jgi:hypothetical protein
MWYDPTVKRARYRHVSGQGVKCPDRFVKAIFGSKFSGSNASASILP